MQPKTERNKELVKKRESDPKKWSFRKLGSYYHLSGAVAHEIYHREKSLGVMHTLEE